MFSHPHNSSAEAVIITFYKEEMQGQRGRVRGGRWGQPCASILVCEFWTTPQGYEVGCAEGGSLGVRVPREGFSQGWVSSGKES